MKGLPVSQQTLLEHFVEPGIEAVALLGSHARGEAGPFSDIDLLRLVADEAAADDGTSHLIAGRLVTVSTVGPAGVERWFTEPDAAINSVLALREARSIYDPTGRFRAIQERARSFVWGEALQEKANRQASRALVGWVEEVLKGLEGLRRVQQGEDATGRLLNARFGLSWGLVNVLRVQRGVLCYSDNAFLDAVTVAVGRDSRWSRLARIAFGLSDPEGHPPSLVEEVTAGLHLYVETVHLLEAALQPEDRPLIQMAVTHIQDELD